MPRKRSFLVAHKTLFLSMGFLVLFAASVSYAVPPTTPYNAGETLDPQCAPTTTNCKVSISSPWTVAGNNDVYYTAANVLIGSATDDSSGRKLQVTGDAGVTGTVSAGSFIGAGTGLTGTATALSIGGNAATVTTNANLTGAITSVGNATSLGSFSSATLATALSDETGTGLAVFSAAPVLASPVIANIAPGADFTLTQNSVAPFTSVNLGAVANTLVLNAGSVGIATTTPGYPLDVTGTIHGSSRIAIGTAQTSQYKDVFGGSYTAGVANPAGFVVNNTMVGAASDYVQNLLVSGTITRVGVMTQADGVYLNAPTLNGAGTVTNANTLFIAAAPTGGVNNYALNVAAGTSIFGGNVGIGTTTPSSQLDLVQAGSDNNLSLSSGGQYTSLNFKNSGTLKAQLYWDNTSSNFNIQSATGTPIVLQGAGGSVGIGTSTPAASLDVANTTGGSLLSARNSSATSAELIASQADRDFSGANNWTGTNWAISGGTFQHTAGSAAAATLPNANLTASSIISGRQYVVTLTVSNHTAGSLNLSLGGGQKIAFGTTYNGVGTVLMTAAANNVNLTIVPQTNFDGAFTNVSVKAVVPSFSVANNGSVYINSNANTLLSNAVSTVDSRSVLSVTRSPMGQGTITVTASGTIVIGTGTNFTSDFNLGDTITANGETHTITVISTNGQLSTDAWTSAFTGTYTTTLPVVAPFKVDGNGKTSLTRLNIANAQTAGSWGTAGLQFSTTAGILTNASAAASSTIATQVANSFGIPTFASINTSVTVTNAATLYIAGAPTQGTNTTITNPLSLYVAAGNSSLMGNLGIGTTSPTAKLDLEGDGTILAAGTRGSGLDVPSLGAGTRLMWYPKTNAFRVGYFNSTQSDFANVGLDSFAFGYQLTASATGATAFGDTTTASGIDSFVSGQNSVASGQFSTAFGVSTTASGNVSTAFGAGTVAASSASAAFGQYNVGGGNAVSWISTDPLFEVGNSTSSGSKSDAIVVLKNGNVGINLGVGVNNPAYNLQVGNSGVTGIVARFQNSTGTCDINPTTSSLVCPSDMRLKKNVTTLADNGAWSFNANVTPDNQTVLARVLALTPVAYNWNSESDAAAKHPGLIAQEVQQVFPDLVATDPQTGLLSMNYTGLIPYAVQAIKEMNITLKALPTFDDPTLTQNIAIFLRGIAERGEAVVNLVTAKKVNTQELCIGDANDSVCVTKTQLQQLLQNNGGGTTVTTPPPPDTPDDSGDTGDGAAPADDGIDTPAPPDAPTPPADTPPDAPAQ